MAPAMATAASAMNPATGPVIDCWICCRGDSQGRPPPPEDASAGSARPIETATSAAQVSKVLLLRDMAVLIDLGIIFGLIAAVAVSFDVDHLTDPPPLSRSLDRDNEIDGFADHLLHRLLAGFRRQLLQSAQG